MIKSTLFTLIAISFSHYIFSQCDITATASQMEITCGESVDLSAFGSSTGQVVLDEDFNSGGFGAGWGSTPGSVNFNNPCDPGNGTPHAWMDNNTSVPRTLQSASFDLSGATAGVTICFDLLFAEQGNAAPCEGPDEPDEGVYFQYSTDGGATWIDIHYFDPNGGNDPMLTNWNTWCFTLPPGALTSNTIFRWHQTADSGADYDHWGIDNVQIFQNDINAEITWLHDGYSYGVGQPGGVNPTAVSPTTTTTYTAQIETGTGDICTADVTVVVLPPDYDVTLSATPTTVCSGDCSTITGTGQVIVDPGGLETYENNEFSLVASGSASVNINVQGINTNSIYNGLIDNVTINGFNFSGSFICTNFGGCPCGGSTVGFGSTCNLDASGFTVTLTSPGGCTIILAPAGVATGNYSGTVFVPVGGTALGGAFPAGGPWDPSDPMSNLNGCDPNGVWTLSFDAPGVGFGIGTLTGWSITFNDPPIYQPVCYQWSPTTGLSNPTDINTTACPAATTTYDLEVSNCVPGCPTYTESVTITVDPCGCTPPTMIINTPAAVCSPGTIDLSTSIGAGSDPATITYHASNADATADINPISQTVAASGTYFIRCEDPGDPACFTVEQVTVTINPLDNASFTFNDFCEGAANSASGIATPGGTFSFNPVPGGGETINPSTGAITGGTSGSSYTVQYQTNGACPATSTQTVNVTGVTYTAAITPEACGAGDGEIVLTPTSGTGPYTYSIDGGTTTQGTGTFSNLTAGNYNIVITDNAGCSVTGTENVGAQGGPTIDNMATNDPSCPATCDGDITVTVSGGTPPYSYQWYDASNNPIGTDAPSIAGLCAGDYSVEVSDANGGGGTQLNTNSDFENGSGAGCDCPTGYTCSNDAGQVFDGNHPVYSAGNNGCVTGATNYSSSLGANSGSGYVYFYAGADAIATGPYAFAGGETVEICVNYSGPQGAGASGQNTANAHFTLAVDGVSVTPDVLVPTNTGWTQYCFTVTMTAGNHTFNILSGGAAQYAIWFDDFTITVQSGGGGGGCPTTQATTLVDPVGADATFTFADYCSGAANGPAGIVTTGGTFAFNPVPGGGETINPSTGVITGGIAGTTYTVEYTTPAPCPVSSTVDVTVNNCCDLAVTTTVVDESCDGLNDGSINFSITGSDTYDVIIDGNVEFNDVNAGAQNWTGQADGTYAVQIVNIADPACDTTFNVTINAGPTLTIGSESATDITDCVNPDGTFTVTAAGATSYELYTSAGGLVTSNATGVFTGLNAGDYYVIAIMGTCSAQSSTLTINNASAPPAPAAGTAATYCSGDAMIDLTATAGSGGTLTWYSDAGLTTSIGTGTTLTPGSTLGATIYYVTETVSGCESPASSVTITINAVPGAPTAGTDATYCNGDPMVDLTATAGMGGTLNWYSDAGLLTNIGTGTTLTPGTTIGATDYYVTETLNGCESASSMVTITINDNPNITAEASTDITDCLNPDGTVTITANGTSYELFDASNNSVSTNATGAFTGLSAGDYYVVVTLNGCTTTSSTFTINNASAPPAPLAGTDATYCSGDAMTDLSATAGSGGTLTWYSDAALTTSIGTGASLTPGSTLGATIYYVTETVSGCESPASTVTITINAVPNAPVAGTNATYCEGDAMANLSATAGMGGTLNWYSDATLMTNIGTGATLAPGTTLGATDYYVTETLNGCESASSMVTITINANPVITAEAATENTSCATPDGTITITANGTSYELFNAANNSIATNATGAFTGLSPGNYYVVVTNGNCTATSTTLVVGDLSGGATNTITGSGCAGDVYTFADGTTQTLSTSTSHISTFTMANGCDSVVTENVTVYQPTTTIIDTSICETGNYTSVGDAANFVNVLADFQHTSTLTSSTGCDSIIIENVTVVPLATISVGMDQNLCFGETMTITATSNAGTPTWSNGVTASSIDYTGSVDTFFVATVTGTCGTASDTIFITVLPPPVIDAGGDITIPLGNATDIVVTSPSVINSYSWTPSTFLSCDDCPDPTVGPLNSVTYIVSGIDENGCVGYDTISVIIDGEVQIYIPNIFSPNNDGENDIFRVYGATWKHYRMEIYNRWGGLIWVSEDPNVEWDGKHKNGEECPQAVFVYKFWGVTNIGLTFDRSGNVMLTR